MSQARFTERLRLAHADAWEAATRHPMTDAIAAGTVPEDVYKQYLVQDHKFLDAFSVLLSSAVSHARKLEDRIPGAQFLAVILGPENTYFERSFSALGVSASERATAPTATTSRFISLMRMAAASGELAEMLAVLVVAEWVYLTWGERAASSRAADLPFWFGEWIDLHAGTNFEGVVAYLRELLDAEAEHMDAAVQQRTERTFGLALRLEIDFWDQAWHGESDAAKQAFDGYERASLEHEAARLESRAGELKEQLARLN